MGGGVQDMRWACGPSDVQLPGPATISPVGSKAPPRRFQKGLEQLEMGILSLLMSSLSPAGSFLLLSQQSSRWVSGCPQAHWGSLGS